MSLEENKAIIRRYYEAANKHNVDLADEFVAPDFVDYTNKIEGLESLKQFGNRFFKGFPDLYWTIEDIVAEGDKVWVRTTVTGTHRGEYRGVPPTGMHARLLVKQTDKEKNANRKDSNLIQHRQRYI